MIEINIKEQNIETTEAMPSTSTFVQNAVVSMRTFTLMEKAGKQCTMKDSQHID